MGFGLPAAIGAQIAQPGRTVIDIDGDGSFTMTMAELATAAEQGLGLKVVILNNEFQGMVRQWQELFFGKRYTATGMKNPDFCKLAEAFGAVGLRVTEKRELPDAIGQMLSTEGCVLMDCHVEPEENVYPMVAVGKSLDEMELGGLA
jgi:acetolactate synthase-1/2/3 large subunit